MNRQVHKIAVLGSGVMGSAIAAHFANAGIPSLVLDIVPAEPDAAERARGLDTSDRRVRDRVAAQSVQALAKAKPAPLFAPERIALIETGNLEDDLPRLAEADWVIEAVREDMAIKKKVLASAAEHLREDAILSSNTSGLSLHEMGTVLPAGLRSRFLGTHFFNPVRYMRLLELIPTEHTDDGVLAFVTRFAQQRLGKGTVLARDTPNFIANRIGTHALMAALRTMEEDGLTVEEVDALTGPAMGRPKTATFRLADLVGLDTLLYVARNTHAATPDDESREMFVPPAFLETMVDKGLLGRKSGAGFYKKVDKPKAILTLDLDSLDYREERKPDFPELAAVKKAGGPADRLRALVGSDGRGARAAWKLLAATLSYAAMRLPEIADDAATVDRALELGFNWDLGPFKVWDALGFRATTERLRADGYPLPPWVDALYESGAERLYQGVDEDARVPTGSPGVLVAPPRDARAVTFSDLRRAGRVVRQNDSASLVDLGDRVLALEFHSKMNAIDGGTVEMMLAAADLAENEWDAIVVANDGTAFCAGANLMMLVEQAQAGNFEGIRDIVRGFQNATNRLERCGVPVVTAPHGLALGGGAEVVLSGNTVRAAAEAYVGLVEVGAGLIPAGGGCMRLYRRHVEAGDPADVYPALRATFEAIGMAKVSGSAEEAQRLGFLGPQDGWSMNREHLLSDAKALALALASAGWSPPLPRRELPVMGRAGIAVIESGLVNMLEGRYISEHDRTIGRELATILSGGDVAGPTRVSEQHMLDLEMESFLRLCGEPKTQERIAALLKTGKPLRN